MAELTKDQIERIDRAFTITCYLSARLEKLKHILLNADSYPTTDSIIDDILATLDCQKNNETE